MAKIEMERMRRVTRKMAKMEMERVAVSVLAMAVRMLIIISYYS